MYISKIMVGQTVKTGDNYNKIEVEGTLSPSDDYGKCKSELQVMIDAHFGETSAPTQAEKPATGEKPARSRRKPKKEAEVVEETAPEEPKEEKKKPARSRRKAADTKPKSKFTAYDRTDKEHKAEISSMLDKEFEGWQKDTGIKKGIKAASTELNGVDFLDSDGVMFEEFVNKFCDILEANAE